MQDPDNEMNLIVVLKKILFSASLIIYKPAPCPLDLCPFWLVKSSPEEVQGALGIINMPLSSETFPGALKEVVERPLFKKATMVPAVAANTVQSLTCCFRIR